MNRFLPVIINDLESYRQEKADCADDIRVSTASGSERSFQKGLIDGTPLTTARGTDSSTQGRKKFFSNSKPTEEILDCTKKSIEVAFVE